MIEEDVNPSHVFLLMLMNFILLWWFWMVKIHNIGKRPWILSFNLYKIIKHRYLFLFHLIINQWIANGFSGSSIMPMALWQGTRLVWCQGFTQVEGINFNEIFSLVARMEQFKLCLQLWPLKISKCIKWILNYFFEWRYFKRKIYAITKGLCDEGKENIVCILKNLYIVWNNLLVNGTTSLMYIFYLKSL
jgi:hypothetical protein